MEEIPARVVLAKRTSRSLRRFPDPHRHENQGLSIFDTKNNLAPVNVQTFLEVGRTTTGVVYFEQSDSWGGCFPTVRDGKVEIKVRLHDVFNKSHTAVFKIPSVSFDEARKYNPSFGLTLATLQEEELPHDS